MHIFECPMSINSMLTKLERYLVKIILSKIQFFSTSIIKVTYFKLYSCLQTSCVEGSVLFRPLYRPVASLETARGHRSQARGHISKSTPTRVVTKSPSQPLTAKGPGERCKFPSGVWGSPSRQRFWCILDINGSIWCSDSE